jgi:hypothetical protein
MEVAILLEQLQLQDEKRKQSEQDIKNQLRFQEDSNRFLQAKIMELQK